MIIWEHIKHSCQRDYNPKHIHDFSRHFLGDANFRKFQNGAEKNLYECRPFHLDTPQFQSIRHSRPVRMARTMESLHCIFCLLRNYNGLDCIRLSLLSNCCCQQPGYSTRHSASVQRNYYLGKIL